MQKLYPVSRAPHMKAQKTVLSRNLTFLFSLFPLLLAAFVFRPGESAKYLGCLLISGLASEILTAFALKKNPDFYNSTVFFVSCLLCLLLPAGLPVYAVALAGAASGFFGKDFFGGAVLARLNPPLLGVVFLKACFPALFQTSLTFLSFWNPFSGFAEVFAASAILAGAGLLLFKQVIFWETPVIYLCLLILPRQLMGIHADFSLGEIALIAFWVLTDSSGTPMTRRGKAYFSAAAALLTLVLDLLVIPQAPALAVLSLNLLSPWMDEWILPAGITFEAQVQGRRK